jgi:hypothetical protein
MSSDGGRLSESDPARGLGAASLKFNFTGPLIWSLSDDNGVSFGAPTAIFSPGTNAQTIDNLVQVTPDRPQLPHRH